MAIPGRSIRLRLVLAAMVTILVALSAAGGMLVSMFEHHAERRLVTVLEADVRELMAGLTVAPDGGLVLGRQPLDQRYAQPFSGSYWQVQTTSRVVERSRSLWDETLTLPADDLAGGQHEHEVIGPQGRLLIAIERQIVVQRDGGPIQLRLSAAQDRSEFDLAVRGFRSEISWMLMLLGALLLVAFALAVSVGLAPLSRLRSDLAELRSGRVYRLAGLYPREVARLVQDLNQLLDDRDKAAVRAGQRAADLAHGLKTPITAISVMAEELADRGDQALARELAQYAATMHRHVERELALARSMTVRSVTTPTRLAPIVRMLVESLKRLPRGHELAWEVDIPDLSVTADAMAVSEIFGNLLDNARKWAQSRVEISARVIEGEVRIVVSDDGPGVAADDLPDLTDRGRRLDLSKPGSGLGLSIVRDIVGQIDGRLTIANGKNGGLEATVVLRGLGGYKE